MIWRDDVLSLAEEKRLHQKKYNKHLYNSSVVFVCFSRAGWWLFFLFLFHYTIFKAFIFLKCLLNWSEVKTRQADSELASLCGVELTCWTEQLLLSRPCLGKAFAIFFPDLPSSPSFCRQWTVKSCMHHHVWFKLSFVSFIWSVFGFHFPQDLHGWNRECQMWNAFCSLQENISW